METDRPPSPSISARAPRWLPGAAVGFAIGLLVKELGLRALVSSWGPSGPSVVGLTLIGALCWSTRLRAWLCIAGLALVLMWLLVAFSPLCRWMSGSVVRVDAPAKADAIYVLASSIQHDDEPTSTALSRATRGLELLGEGWAPRLLLTELRRPQGSYLRYLRTSATRMGVAHADAIEAIGVVYNTHDEAMLVAEQFRAHGWHKLILVTSPTHSRRAAAAFEQAGVPQVISVPSIETNYDLEDRHQSSDGNIYAFGPLAHEWLGIVVYRLRGWVH